jgi:hypothetical protein
VGHPKWDVCGPSEGLPEWRCKRRGNRALGGRRRGRDQRGQLRSVPHGWWRRVVAAGWRVTHTAQPSRLILVEAMDDALHGPTQAWWLTAPGPITITGKTGSKWVTGVPAPAGTYVLTHSPAPSSATPCSYPQEPTPPAPSPNTKPPQTSPARSRRLGRR